jgi:hypothetical protein
VRQIQCLNVVLVVFAFNKSGVQAFSLKKSKLWIQFSISQNCTGRNQSLTSSAELPSKSSNVQKFPVSGSGSCSPITKNHHHHQDKHVRKHQLKAQILAIKC